ncbi:MAG: response regulator [Blastochloris sp.]|nr:response regulator [Blastochloris sp.]
MKATVLVVDDEAVVQRLLGDALIRAGYDVELVSAGAAAIERLAHPGVDLVLLDLQLGDMDGIQVMEIVHNRWPQIPIIMLTAHGSLSSAIAAVRCDVADYLLKPVSVETLRERVRRVLAESQTVRRRDEQLQEMYQRMQSFLQSQGLLAETPTEQNDADRHTSISQSRTACYRYTTTHRQNVQSANRRDAKRVCHSDGADTASRRSRFVYAIDARDGEND